MKLIKPLISNFFILLLVSMNINCMAQETKIPIAGNGVLQQYAKDHPQSLKKEKNIQQALILPFFDDFSASYIYPDSNKWIGRSVFVNNGFGVNPPTIGVATFDGLDSAGNYYQNANFDYPSDTLTSQPIDLSLLTTDNSIYLSFFYQAGGYGDPPNDGDSLILQFLNNDTNWVTVWEVDGNSVATDFQQVFVHVYDTIYYYNGFTYDTLVDTFRTANFQFRFMNLVYGYGMEAIWNIDYVYLNNHRDTTDTTMFDMAFVYPGPPLLKNYSQMPWSHYVFDSTGQNATQYYETTRNNDIISHFLKFHTEIFESGNPIPIYQFDTGGYDYFNNPQSDSTINLRISYGIPSNFTYPITNSSSDYQEFLVKHYIEQTNGDGILSNDTINNVQRFANYYAYDDGSAEWSLGLVNAPGGEMAMQFTIVKSDTCQGVYIFWPRMIYNTALDDFSIAVWSDNGGQPGTLIYKKAGIYPTFDTTQLNGFIFYRLDSNIANINDTVYTQPSLAAGTYYFGFIQGVGYPDYSEPLAIGLDENSNWDSTKLWINTNNAWTPSVIDGSIMIRPVFGTAMSLGIKNMDNQLANSLSIFPNPASDKINLNWTTDQYVQSNDLLVQIYDPQERLILSKTGFQNQIDITGISEGFYLIKVTDTKTATSFTKKLIINR